MRREDIRRAHTDAPVAAHAFYGSHLTFFAHQPGDGYAHVADTFTFFAARAELLFCLYPEKPGKAERSPKCGIRAKDAAKITVARKRYEKKTDSTHR